MAKKKAAREIPEQQVLSLVLDRDILVGIDKMMAWTRRAEGPLVKQADVLRRIIRLGLTEAKRIHDICEATP